MNKDKRELVVKVITLALSLLRRNVPKVVTKVNQIVWNCLKKP